MHRLYTPSDSHDTASRGSPGARPKPVRLRALLPWIVAAGAATGIYSVGTKEHAVVRRFGRALERLSPPGLSFGLPYGLDRVTRVQLLERKRVPVGMGSADRILGRLSEPILAECLTGDRNLVVVSAYAQYEISDARAYLFRAAGVPTLVSAVTAGGLTSAIARRSVDEVLTTDRVAIQEEVKAAAQRILDRCGAGVRISAISLDRTSAPNEVADAFQDVTRARGDRQRAVNEADGYARRILPEARGEEERIRLEAEAYAEATLELARAAASSFLRMASELEGRREITMRRLYVEALERILPRVRKVILDEESSRGLDLGILEAKE